MSTKAKNMAMDAARAGIAAMIALYLANGQAIFDLNEDGVKALVAAGITATLTVVLRWLQPGGEYGRAAK
jgi:hypothetical protein